MTPYLQFCIFSTPGFLIKIGQHQISFTAYRSSYFERNNFSRTLTMTSLYDVITSAHGILERKFNADQLFVKVDQPQISFPTVCRMP